MIMGWVSLAWKGYILVRIPEEKRVTFF